MTLLEELLERENEIQWGIGAACQEYHIGDCSCVELSNLIEKAFAQLRAMLVTK